MGHQPQPVPPIFQPELAARAIVWAARHKRREVYVGGTTLLAVWGSKILGRALDRYLARTGYDSQLTEELVPPDRPDNLFATLPGDRGAHGRFDARARERSGQFEFTSNRALILGSLALGVGIGALAVRRFRAAWSRDA
jgi:hypothetical protein